MIEINAGNIDKAPTESNAQVKVQSWDLATCGELTAEGYVEVSRSPQWVVFEKLGQPLRRRAG
jgi:hypothetical protein